MRALFLTKTPECFAATLDARVKLALCVLGSVSVIVFSSPLSLGVLLAFVLALAIFAMSAKSILRVVVFCTVLNALTLAFAGIMSFALPGLMRWNALSLSTPYLRILIVMLLLMTLAFSTPVQVIANRLQWVRLPGFVYIPLSIAIRFIPTFAEDCRQISDAARLRPGTGIRSFFRGLLIPLIFRLLASADDLAVAAELKGIHAQGKAVLPPAEPMGKQDIMVLSGAGVVFLVALGLQLFGPVFAKAVY